MIRDLTEALAVAITLIGIFMLAWALTGTDEPEPVSYVTFDPNNHEYPQCPVGNIVVHDFEDGTWFCEESTEWCEYGDNYEHDWCYEQRFRQGREEYCPDYKVDWEPCDDDEGMFDH